MKFSTSVSANAACACAVSFSKRTVAASCGNDPAWRPNIPKSQKDYFYNQKHQTVDIIKLNGSVELEMESSGLSDVIVDIVETGSP